MKNIEEYIKQITTHKNYDNKYDYLDNIILDHCYIHYAFNYRLVTESNIYENDGAFPQQHKLIKFILEEINKEQKDTYIFNLNYDFIKKLHIYLRTNNIKNINGGYIANNSDCGLRLKFRPDTPQHYEYITIENSTFTENLLDKLIYEIIIYNYDKYPDGLIEMLYHETKHLWDDYIEISKKNIFLNDKIKKSLNYKFNNKNINDTLKDIIYYSEDYEISAYITQINGVLKKSYIDIKEAFNDIYDCPIYQNYKFIYYSIISDEYKDKLLKYISNKEYNKIKNNIRSVWKKIIKVSYEVCCNHLDKNRMAPTVIGHKIHKK